MKVLKFGGSSVRDASRILRVAELIEASLDDARPPAVVVSALGGITDDLKALPALALADVDEAYSHLARLEQRHVDTLEALAPGSTDEQQRLNDAFDRLRKIAGGIHLLQESSARTLDEVITYGELLSAPIVAAALRARGHRAEAYDTRELVVTHHRFGGARALLEPTFARLRAALTPSTDRSESPSIPVISGFVARSDRGATTHLGRGGSDLTAALVAAALEVDALEIWTDVDGVLTADPRDVPEARSIRQMSFEELMELSHFGAKVVYPPTVQPVRAAGIALSIHSTLEPDSPGTRIVEQRSEDVPGNPVVGVAAIDHVSLLRLEGDGMIGIPGTAGRLFQALARKEISVILISQASSEHSICFAIDPQQSHRARQVVDAEFELERRAGVINPLIVEDDCAVVAAVGAGMCSEPGIAGRVFRVLGERGINVRAIAQGSSERNISLVIDRSQKGRAVRVVHRAFFGELPKRVRVGLVGVGGVGSELLRQLGPGTHASRHLEVVATASSRRAWCGELEGEWPTDWRAFLEEHGEDGDAKALAAELIQLDGPRLFIDCSASDDVAELYPELLAAGIGVVAANKKGFADRSEKSAALFTADGIYLEATVGAGLPVLSTLRDLVTTGDEVKTIDGVLSGTLAFVLDRLLAGETLSAAVREAHQAGYTEPDPREDLSGQDVARKLLILARGAGFGLEPGDLHVEPLVDVSGEASVEEFLRGLADLDEEFRQKVEAARDRDEKLCYLARFDGERATVGLQSIAGDHPAFALSGTDNLIAFATQRYDATPLVVRGPGAGTAVTAAGVLGDALRAAREMRRSPPKPMRRRGVS
ncbi:MAG: bifunctional aspartate kinase/homoserine dehydrogenase I [Acidobacteriota bacterium]